jgi:hypothetical protein
LRTGAWSDLHLIAGAPASSTAGGERRVPRQVSPKLRQEVSILDTSPASHEAHCEFSVAVPGIPGVKTGQINQRRQKSPISALTPALALKKVTFLRRHRGTFVEIS